MDGPVAVREQLFGLFEWLGQAFSILWAGDSADNGMLIDPDGQPSSGSGPSADDDNGVLIDPNG